jgi:sterol desaturase/sphingolipid hydroxylase (fatty acid hydroxylase superfamily)
MTLDPGELNWLAVVVGALVYFGLGALWYSPVLFARAWQRSIGWDETRTPPQASATTYVVPFVAYLVMATAVGLIAAATGTDELGEGIVLGLVLGIGLSLAHTFVDASFDPNKPEPWTWFAINGTYHALGLVIVSVIVAIWP